MAWAKRKSRDAQLLYKGAISACAIAFVAIVLLVVFTALGEDAVALLLGVVAVLASGLAVICCLRSNSVL